jgi:hypothetical protein|tara:strand:- start:263 stop:571 length:309 start_codon:yes stop_codon:yes gene_type:complete
MVDSYANINDLIDGIYETNFEKENNITITTRDILEDISNNEIKVIIIGKSNGEFGLVLAFLISRKLKRWVKIYPYELQLDMFPSIYNKYKEIDTHNQKYWKK